MRAKRTDRIGEKSINSYGTEMIIIEYCNEKEIYVEFQDEYKAIVKTRYWIFKQGSVANPYDKTVYNVGCLGLMSNGEKQITKVNGVHDFRYVTWHGMIERCYGERSLKLKPTYKDAEVCDRWLVYANFLEDLPLIEGYELYINSKRGDYIVLDKDIKGNGAKLYCVENCCFVTQSNNVKEIHYRKYEDANGKVVVVPIHNCDIDKGLSHEIQKQILNN